MKAIDYARLVGYVAVKKSVVGSVLLTTTPTRTLVTGETTVLATSHMEAEHILDTTNIAALVHERKIVLVF